MLRNINLTKKRMKVTLYGYMLEIGMNGINSLNRWSFFIDTKVQRTIYRWFEPDFHDSNSRILFCQCFEAFQPHKLKFITCFLDALTCLL